MTATITPTMPPSTMAQEQAWNAQCMQAPVTAPQWRVWTFDAPAIVLGCGQRAFFEAARARWPQNWEMLQRPSGGGAVLTGPWMVSCSVALPLDHPWVQGRLPESYRALGELHVQALGALGVASRALPTDEIPAANAHLGPAIDWACYGSLAPWEVVDVQHGRKLVGLAQRRQRTGILLVAGTLVGAPDWGLLCAAMGQTMDCTALEQRTVSCPSISENPPSGADFAAALRCHLTQALQTQESPVAPPHQGC